MLRLDGVQFNMTYYVWGDGAEDDLRDGLLVLLTSVINDELSEDCPPLANFVKVHIYKQGMALKYEDPHGGYVVELPTEGVISTAFDYDRDTIQDVFEKLIKPKNMVHLIVTI